MDSAPFAKSRCRGEHRSAGDDFQELSPLASNVISLSLALGTRCFCRNLLRSQNLGEQKHISEQCTQVQNRLQISQAEDGA